MPMFTEVFRNLKSPQQFQVTSEDTPLTSEQALCQAVCVVVFAPTKMQQEEGHQGIF